MGEKTLGVEITQITGDDSLVLVSKDVEQEAVSISATDDLMTITVEDGGLTYEVKLKKNE
jgi:hypothetical protein